MSAPEQAKFTEETVLSITRHTGKLMSFVMTRPEAYRFDAGQFARLGFRDGKGFLWRAYSMVSAEYDDVLEFFVVLIDGGPMSARFESMKEGDTVLLDKNATGFLLPGRFADGNDLVMLSTGSGIAPFLSMIRQPDVLQRFRHVALVHSVSFAHELVFAPRMAALAEDPLVGEYANKVRYLPVLTRDADAGLLHRRLPALLADGSLEKALGLAFSPQDTRFMICGNPAMVQDTFAALLALGFSMHRNKTPGQIMMENAF